MKILDTVVEHAKFKHVPEGDIAALAAIERVYGGVTPGDWAGGRMLVARDAAFRQFAFCRFVDKPGRTVLRRVVVDPRYRGRGTGRTFVERLRLRLVRLGLRKLVAYTDDAAVGTNLFMAAVGFAPVRAKNDRIKWECGPLDYRPDTIYSDGVAGVVG